jgi:hypothetical protein
VGHPHWREVGFVLFSICWASPAQNFSDLSPTGFMSIVYCRCFETPPTRRARFLYLIPLSQSQSQSYITTDSLSASLSWYQAPTWARDQFFPILSLVIFFDSVGFVDVGRPLWREVGSVLFSICQASPVQNFSGLSPTGLMSIVYCLYFWDSPNQEGQVPVFISAKSKSKPDITTDSLLASLSWYQALTWDPWPIFPILSLFFFFNSFGFVDVGRPLWQEVSGLYFLVFARQHQHSLSQIRVPLDSWT